VPYDFTAGHHGPPDTGFFVFVKVADNGQSLVSADPAAMSK
jgi:hypothetical protein